MSNIYGTGGRLKRGKMVIAHFNPHELNGLDFLQGKKETCPRSGMRSYSHLEELLKNPHLLKGLIASVDQISAQKRHHRARGGGLHDYHSSHLNRMADGGIHGDTELALIGPHTRNVFDHLVAAQGYPVETNPHTGHPHYGLLDGIIGGIGNILTKIPIIGPAIGNLAKTFLPGLLPAVGELAQKHLPKLGEHFGGETGKKMADMAGQFINKNIQDNVTQEQRDQGRGYADRLSDMGQNAYDAYQRGGIGGAARDLGGQAINQVSQYLPSNMRGYADQVGQGLQRGQSLEDIARGVGGGALRDVSGQMGGRLGQYGNQLASGIGQGQNPRDLARRMISQPSVDEGYYNRSSGEYTPGELFG